MMSLKQYKPGDLFMSTWPYSILGITQQQFRAILNYAPISRTHGLVLSTVDQITRVVDGLEIEEEAYEVLIEGKVMLYAGRFMAHV